LQDPADILADRAEPAVLVVGDVMLDEHVHCAVAGFSPEDDLAPKLTVKARTHTPGGAANVAMNLHCLGARVALAGYLGKDQAGQLLLSLLDGVEGIYVRGDKPTTHKSRLITERGRHVARVDAEVQEPLDSELEEYLRANCVGRFDVVVVSDYAKGVVTPGMVRHLESAFKDVPVVVDPKRADFGYYGNVTAFTPNLKELKEAAGHYAVPGVAELYRELSARHPKLQALIVTCSEEGCTLTRGRETEFYHTRKQETVDPCGCGDSFLAGLAYALGKGGSLSAGCRLGNVCGSCAVCYTGVHAVTKAEALAELGRFAY
jgi:D-beta-D-heptose 7-phosphate kinase/D-beta-D-heptose 1-phosphate adenosyltransferase